MGSDQTGEAAHAIKLNSSEWDKALEKLAALFDGANSAGLGASPQQRTRPVPQAEASADTFSVRKMHL